MNKLSLYEQVFNAIKSKKKVKVIKVCGHTFVIYTCKPWDSDKSMYNIVLKDISSRMINKHFFNRSIDLAQWFLSDADYSNNKKLKNTAITFFYEISKRIIRHMIHYKSECYLSLNIEPCRNPRGDFYGWEIV